MPLDQDKFFELGLNPLLSSLLENFPIAHIIVSVFFIKSLVAEKLFLTGLQDIYQILTDFLIWRAEVLLLVPALNRPFLIGDLDVEAHGEAKI